MDAHRRPSPELRAFLTRIAGGHQPDRSAMLRRIARHRTGPPVTERPPVRQALRLAGSALAVVIILGVGGVARWSLADGPDPGVEPVAPPAATPSSRPAVRPSTPPSKAQGAAPSVAASRSPRAKPSSPPPPARKAEPRQPEPVSADGSVTTGSDDTVGRSDITVDVREPLSALTVTVRLASAAGLSDQGGTHDADDAAFGVTVVREKDTLVYRFKLAAGTALAPGTYVFTAKYEGGRDAGADTFLVTGATAGRRAEVDLAGDFD